MASKVDREHPLYIAFREAVGKSLWEHVSTQDQADTADYLADLLVTCAHTDSLFRIRNASGQPVVSVAEMIAEGDIRLNASSFERERVVHQHIGDFILFWSGLSPQFLRQLKLHSSLDLICDYPKQAQQSYNLVSTYEEPIDPVAAKTFRKLSDGFEDYAFCLNVVRDRLGLMRIFEA